MRVVLIGASANPQRYANMAMKRLLDKGHELVLVNPALSEIDGHPVVNTLSQIQGSVDTVTLYIGPERLELLIEDILALSPRRIISNPGTELSRMETLARERGIEYIEACTLVLLSTGQF